MTKFLKLISETEWVDLIVCDSFISAMHSDCNFHCAMSLVIYVTYRMLLSYTVEPL